MAHFCIVAPVNILQKLEEEGDLGTKHLLLAHDVVKYPKEYQQLFGDRFRTKQDLIILDNSAYELKSSVDFGMVKEATQICRPTCVVLPDHYLKGEPTVIDTLSSIDLWALELENYHVDLMAIPQGKTYKEWIWCAEQMQDHPGIQWWGVPRNLQEVHKVSRREGAHILHALNPRRSIHLFGFSDNYVDDLLASRHPAVNSIDSTTPLRAGSLGMDWSLSSDYPPRGDWWETAQWNPTVSCNLAYAQKVFANGTK
jgi:hypothetical protein